LFNILFFGLKLSGVGLVENTLIHTARHKFSVYLLS